MPKQHRMSSGTLRAADGEGTRAPGASAKCGKMVIFLRSSGGRSLGHLLYHHVDVVAYAFSGVIAQFAI
jgi:hypothetical protein